MSGASFSATLFGVYPRLGRGAVLPRADPREPRRAAARDARAGTAAEVKRVCRYSAPNGERGGRVDAGVT